MKYTTEGVLVVTSLQMYLGTQGNSGRGKGWYYGKYLQIFPSEVLGRIRVFLLMVFGVMVSIMDVFDSLVRTLRP